MNSPEKSRKALSVLFYPTGLAAVLYSVVLAFSQTAPASDPERHAALALEQQGKNAEAETAWKAYSKAHASSPEPYAHLGLLAARQGDYQQAVPLYRKALELGPGVPGLRLNLGLALFKSSDLRGAIKEFEAVLKAQPGNQQATTLLGMAHYGLAEYPVAIPYLKDAAAHDAQSLPLRFALAQSCLWAKQTQCVLDVYQEILKLNPDSAQADMLAGEAMDEMKDNAGSTKMFRAAVKADPKTPNAHFGLGYLLWSQKQFPEAISEFKAELKNDPDHVQANLYMADADIQINQMSAAKPLLEKVEKQDSSIALIHLDLGIVYTDAGQNEDALRELAFAEKQMPDDVNVHWRLARLYRAVGKPDQAKAEFEKASKLNKKADDDLYQKIATGKERQPGDQATPASSPQPDQQAPGAAEPAQPQPAQPQQAQPQQAQPQQAQPQ